MLQKGDSTLRLPVQLLARILQLSDLQTRLQTCALVCSSWHKAAVLSVRDITAKDCTPQQAAALSAWLSAHGSEAQVTSIAVTAERWRRTPDESHVMLPVKQLSQLRALKLGDVKASVFDAHGRAAPLFDGPGGVTGLTRLELRDCYVSLQGLRSCTALQRLEVGPAWREVFDPANVSHLLEALPQLSSSLTSLALRNAACPDRLMLQLSSLRALQELHLWSPACSTASFSSLPSGLTKLHVGFSGTWSTADWEGPVFSPSTTPGVCQLTALQDLTIFGARAVDVALLSSLVQLSRLELECTPLVTPAGGTTLRALSALTRMQHLSAWELRREHDVAFDCAALMALQQLTYLELPACIHPDLDVVFPQDLQLPHLEELVLPFELFSGPLTTDLFKACLALKKLSVELYHDRGGWQDDSVQVDRSAVVQLTGLGTLTNLQLSAPTLYIGREEWGALARLTGLQALGVGAIKLHCGDGFEQLTALRQVTYLCHYWEVREEGERPMFKVFNNNPAGSPSTVWSQLAAVAPQLLGPCVEAMDSVDFDTQCNVAEAFWGAVDKVVRQQEQQQGQQQQQQDQQQDLELTQLRQRVAALEAQVAGLQAELAAVRL